jgi:hypothetical protein
MTGATFPGIRNDRSSWTFLVVAYSRGRDMIANFAHLQPQPPSLGLFLMVGGAAKSASTVPCSPWPLRSRETLVTDED